MYTVQERGLLQCIHVRPVAEWDSLSCFKLFNKMRRLSKEKPNLVTLILVASACTSIKCFQLGRQLHGYMVKDVLGFETKVGTSPINLYSKCGSWESACQVF